MVRLERLFARWHAFRTVVVLCTLFLVLYKNFVLYKNSLL